MLNGILSRRIVFLVSAIAGLAAPGLAPAADPAVEDSYGRGVHAYFTGNTFRALEYLSAAIQAGSHDARVYYFRGLTYLNLGDEYSARDDFAKGAELEAREQDRFYDIGKSLERVQGSARLTLERYRSNARIAAARLREQRRMQRYEAIRRAQPAPPPVAAAAPDAAAPAASPAGMAPAEAPAAAPGDNPFGAPAQPAAPAADPFGT